MENKFYTAWLNILGEERLNSFRSPIDITTVFESNDGLQASLWFLKSSEKSDVNEIQKFHLKQINPDSEPTRFSLHPDHASRHRSHRLASEGFTLMQMALQNAETFEQIWGLMTYGTLYRHCLSQKSDNFGFYRCDQLLELAKKSAGDYLPEFDKKSWHILPDIDTDESLYKLPDEQANIWIANSHCKMLDNYSFKTVQLTMDETEVSLSLREEEARRRTEWLKEFGESSGGSPGNNPSKKGLSL